MRVELVGSSAYDLRKFIAICDAVLGENVAAEVDSARHDLTHVERWVSMFQLYAANVEPSPNIWSQTFYSVAAICDDRDMLDLLACCNEMPAVVSDTVRRNVAIAIIGGTVPQWQHAIDNAAAHSTESVGEFATSVCGLLTAQGANIDRSCREARKHIKV